MDENLVRYLIMFGAIAFVVSAVLFARTLNNKTYKKLKQRFESNYPMFKVFFNHSTAISKDLDTPLLTLKRSKGGRFILPVSLFSICIIIAVFYKGSLIFKILALAAFGLWFIWSALNATNYVIVFKNALVHGNIFKKKVLWLNELDSIEARLYDYKGPMDERQAQVYRVYDVKRNGKDVFGIWETEFSDARMIENCFDAENPVVDKIQISFDKYGSV